MMGVSHSHTGSDRRECCDLDVGPHVLSASPVTTHEVDQELGAGHTESLSVWQQKNPKAYVWIVAPAAR
jgi:hypothetical protein